MATGVDILGTRQLDVLSCNVSEVATIGNTGSNTIIRLYDNNLPFKNPYLFGLSNTSFFVMRGDSPQSTQFNIGSVNSIPGVQLQVTGHMTTCNLGVGTTAPLAALHVHNGAILSTTASGSPTFYADNSRVGIGISTPTSTLHVAGDTTISGVLTVGRLVELAGSTKFRMVDLYLGDGNNSKTIMTSDTTAANRILFTFSIDKGSYILNANIPYTNISSLMPLDTVNWAVIGLYKTNVAGFTNASVPIYTCPLIAIGGGSTDFDSAYFTTALSVDDSTLADYVIAVTGLGHLLRFGGTGVPVPKLYVVPTTGLGVDDGVAVRQALQLAPIRRSFVATSGQRNFSITEPGVFSTISSNIDVFVNGIKSSNVTVAQNLNVDQTTFTVSLASGVALNTPVEVSIWPQAVGTNFYSSGYLYQSIANFSAPFQNVQGGGIRSPSRMIIDGDLIVRGQIYSGCNTALFPSGVQWDGKLADITSNVIGTLNLIDGCVTTSKLTDGCVTTANIADGTITSDKIAQFAISNINIADGAITESKLNLGSGNVGVGVTLPRAHWHVNGTVMTNTALSVANTNQYISYDFNQADVGSIISFQTSNVSLTMPAVIRVDARAITQTSGTLLGSWGGVFTQGNSLYQPTFFSAGGYQNGAYIQFSTKALGGVTSYTFDMQNNNGLTVAALVRFDSSTGANFIGDNIFVLYDVGTPTRYITLQRNAAIATTLDFIVSSPTGSYTLSIPNIVITNEWALYTVIMDRDTNVTVYKNGKVIGSGTSAYPTPTFQYNAIYNLTPLLCRNIENTSFGRMSYVAFHAYSKILSADEVAIMTNYMLQGWAGLNRSAVLPNMQLNPTPYVALDSASAPVANLDINANMRVHVLPEAPLWAVDAFSSRSIFLNSDATLPTFNTSMGYITCQSTKYMELGPRMYNIKSCGFTFVAKFSVSGATAGDNILYVGVSPPTAPGSDNYIQIRRSGTTQTFILDMRFNGLSPYTMTFTEQFVEGQVYTLAVLIDYGVVIGVWINGVKNVAEASLLPTFNDIIDTTFKYTRVGTFTGTLYCAAMYNRPLSDVEIAQAHTTLTSDTPHAGLEIGSRTGRSAFVVTRDGLIPSLTLGTDNAISGLLAHISLDNHLYDTRQTFGVPSVNGIIQFNSRGRMGSSLVLNNMTGNVAQQHGVSYTTSTSFQIPGKSISFWMKPYETGGNVNYMFSIVSSAATPIGLVDMYITPSGGRSVVNMSIRNGAGALSTLSATSFPLTSNEWNHVATTIQNDASISLYVNGFQAASNNIVSVSSCNVGRLLIGCQSNQSFPFMGELDDLRIYSKSLSAVEVQQLTSSIYKNTIEIKNEDNTTNVFTTNTTGVRISTPLQLSSSTSIQSVITNANTMENTLQVNTMNYEVRDMTFTHCNISMYGSASIVATSPYDSMPDEGSIYIPGTTGSFAMFHYATPSTSFANTNGVTLECWVNYQSIVNATSTVSSVAIPCLCGIMSPFNSTLGYSLGVNNNGVLTFASYSNATTTTITGTTLIPINTWNHIAVSIQSNNTTRIFLNGLLEGTATVGYPDFSTTTYNTFAVGAFNQVSVNAYIANLRFARSTLYTSSFTPSVAPLPVVSNSIILLRCIRVTSTPLSLTSKGAMTLIGTVNAPNMNMFRNKIINGAMNIDQRRSGVQGSQSGGGNTFIYTVDRWLINANITTGAYTFIRQPLTTIDTPYRYGFTNSLLITITVPFTSYIFILPEQFVEAQLISDLCWTGNGNGFYATLSFWFRAKQTGQYQTCIRRSWFSPDNQSFLQTFNYTTADTWQFITIIVPPPPGTGVTWARGDNESRMQIYIGAYHRTNTRSTNGWFLPGDAPETTLGCVEWVTTANNYIQFTGVQFEKGQQATPFEFRSDNIELQLCKRYYENSGGVVSVFPGCETSASITNTSNIGSSIFISPKRSGTTYNVTTYDTANNVNKVSTKFANQPLTTNITSIVDDKRNNSFYIGISNTDYATVTGGAQAATFARGNLLFRWEVVDES